MQKIIISPLWAIDSFRIFIENKEIEYLNTDDLQTQTIHTLGEIIEQKDKSTKISVGPEQSIYLHKTSINQGPNNPKIEGLVITASAKILGINYFKGITNENINTLYDIIIKTGIIYITKQTFLESRISDLDLKKDFLCTLDQFLKTKEILQKNTKLTTTNGCGYTPHNKQTKYGNYTNLGIEWGNRFGTANKNVMLKFYKKDIEFNYKAKSKQFKDIYFENQTIPDMARREFNINNRKRFQTFFGKKNFTLINILNLTQSEITKAFQTTTQYHLNIKPMKIKQNLESMQSFWIRQALKLNTNNNDYQEQLDLNYLQLSQEIEYQFTERKDKSKKSRYKQILLEIYKQLKDQKEQPENNQEYINKYKEFLLLD